MTTGNETNEGQTWGAPIQIWVFSYLTCDRRDRVLFRTARRNYDPAAWEFATVREPKHLNLPLRKFLRLSKPRSWTGDPEHVKYRSISLGPLANAGFMFIFGFPLLNDTEPWFVYFNKAQSFYLIWILPPILYTSWIQDFLPPSKRLNVLTSFSYSQVMAF